MKKTNTALVANSGIYLTFRLSMVLLTLGLQLADPHSNAIAAPEDLDLNFGTDGRVYFDKSPGWDSWNQVIALPKGHVLVAGTAGTGSAYVTGRYVAKLNQNGQYENTFGVSGLVTLDLPSSSYGNIDGLINLKSGKILTVVSYQYTSASIVRTKYSLIRLQPDGTLDNSFGGNGMVQVDTLASDFVWVSGFAEDPYGRIIIAGGTSERNSIAVMRLTQEGYLDTTFSSDGMVKINIYQQTTPISMAIQSDGKIVIAGFITSGMDQTNNNIFTCRLTTDGGLDPGFANGWIFSKDIRGNRDEAHALIVRPNGKIVLGGLTQAEDSNQTNSLFISLNPDGSLDDSFGTEGIVEIDASGNSDSISAMSLMPDGRIMASCYAAVGDNLRMTVVRIMPNGMPDPSLGSGGVAVIPSPDDSVDNVAWNIKRDAAGRILLSGYSNTVDGMKGMLVRLIGDPDSDGDGIPDSSETGTGIYVSPFDTGTDPHNPDTDGDGLSDGDEVFKYFTNPLLPDTDGDGFLDGYEVQTGKSPLDPNDKPALVAEVRTAIEFTFPTAIGKTYRIEASPDMTTWNPIEGNIVGSGTSVTRFYTTRNMPKRFLRVEEQAGQ